MAKKAAAATEEKETKSTEEKLPYGVPELAEELGIEPASVRVKLRSAGIDKTGRSYGWKNQKDFQAVVKQLKSSDKPAKADKDDEGGEEAAPKKTKTKVKSKK